MKPETGRNNSFLKVIEILQENYNEPITMVETGCIRNTNDESKFGDGWSTLNWKYYSDITGSRVYIVDINDNNHVSQSMKIVPPSELITYTIDDSVHFLQNFDKKIDFLFLDSVDYVGDSENILKCQNHQLNEIKAAWDKLNEKCYVLIDDVFGLDWEGKGKFSIPFLLENGFEVIHFIDSQVFLKRK